VDALRVYGKDYASISQYVGTRDVKQVKSHAQKYKMILEKNSDPESQEMLKVLSVNLRVLKHSERVTYRGGELPNQEPSSLLEEMK